MRAIFQNSRIVGGRMRIERRWWGRGIMEVRGGIGLFFLILFGFVEEVICVILILKKGRVLWKVREGFFFLSCMILDSCVLLPFLNPPLQHTLAPAPPT